MSNDVTKNAGPLYAVLAYGIWGFLPVYFKQIANVSADEILMHRIIWSFVFTVALIIVVKGVDKVKAVLKQPKYLIILFFSSGLIATNWGLYIWAVNNDRILESSLGYYINPIVNVLLGMLVLGERLRNVQWAAVVLAATGVTLEIINFGSIPWVALTLAFSFGTYGLLRKMVPVDAQTGLLLETTILLLPALVYIVFFIQSDTSNLMNNSWQLNSLLLLAGPVTSIPLMFFAAAAQRLNYSTLGFFQYIAPSLLFLLAVTLYNEPLTTQKMITFIFIWVALAIFSIDAYRWQKRIQVKMKAD